MMPDPARPRPCIPVRYGSRYGSDGPAPRCPVCTAPRPSSRARYCSEACKQRAYRHRRAVSTMPDPTHLAGALQRLGQRVAQTVYECSTCDQRLLGERRCPDCHRFCRAVGLGGACPQCDEPILLAELLGLEAVP